MRKNACGTIVNGAIKWVEIRKSVKDG